MLNGRKIEDVEFNEWFNFLRTEKKRLDPKNKYYQAANNSYFTREKSSFIGSLVHDLLEKRKELKGEMKKHKPGSIEYNNAVASQSVAKELANSMFGITGDKRSRYFNQNMCEAITLTGQYLNKASSAAAEKMGLMTIYGDTDSIFLLIDDDTKMEVIVNELNERLSEHLKTYIKLHKNIIALEYEKKFTKLIMLDKKKYTGWLTEQDGREVDMIFSRGTENIKKNTVEFARRAVIELIEMIVKEDVDIKKVKRWLRKLKDKTFNEETVSGNFSR